MKKFLPLVILLALLIPSFVYTIDEREQAIITEFGEFKRSVTTPGIHFKKPFVEKISRFEKRMLSTDAPPGQYLTLDKKRLVVDFLARWRIEDPLVFYKSVRNLFSANTRIEDIVYSELREEMATHNINEVIAENRELIMNKVKEGSSEKLKSTLAPYISEKTAIVFVPSRYIVQKGANLHFPSEKIEIILGIGTPVVPLFIENLSETQLSIEDNKIVAHSYGEILDSKNLSIAAYQESLLKAGERAFSSHQIFENSLVFSILRGLKLKGNTTSIFDGNDGSETKFTKIFGASAAFSKIISQSTQKKRVGIVLPPGKGGLVANLAVLLSGKIPVNLNFTAGSEAIISSIEQAKLDHIITAQAFIDKYPEFPWPEKDSILLIEKLLPPLKPKIILWLSLIHI